MRWGEVESYPVLFEDFLERCGCCGSGEHFFDSYPMRMLCNPVAVGAQGCSSAPSDQVAASASEANPSEGEWIKFTRKNLPPPPLPMFGHDKAALFKLFGTNVVYSTESSSSKVSSNSGVLSINNPVVVEEQDNDVMEPLMVAKLAPFPPLFDLPGDVNDALFYPDPTDTELFAYDNEKILDYGDELKHVDGFGELSPNALQDEIANVFIDVAPSSEFLIPDLSNPALLTASILNPSVASAESISVAREFEQLGVEMPTKFDSSKCKLGVEDDDVVSSPLMGGCSKRGKHAE